MKINKPTPQSRLKILAKDVRLMGFGSIGFGSVRLYTALAENGIFNKDAVILVLFGIIIWLVGAYFEGDQK